MSYLKTRNSIFTINYLQGLIYKHSFQSTINNSFFKKKQFCLTEYIRQSYRCTGVLHTRKKRKEKKRKSKKYYKIKSTGDELNVGYDKVNFPVGV